MKKLLFCLLALVATTALGAESAGGDAAAQAAIKAAIAKKFPDINVEVVRPSPMKGIYEVVMGADTAYVSADGKFLIAGDMYEIDTRTNVTEAGRQKTRIDALAKLDEREMIVFKPQTVKHTITVFTDVDCGYCRKLHSEVKQLTDLGIKVRYLAYPRAGPGTEDWRKMEAVWCSKDRNNASSSSWASRWECAARRPFSLPAATISVVIWLPARCSKSWIGCRRPPKSNSSRLEALASWSAPRFKTAGDYFSSSFNLSALPSHSLASGGAAFFSVITGQDLARSALICLNCS